LLRGRRTARREGASTHGADAAEPRLRRSRRTARREGASTHGADAAEPRLRRSRRTARREGAIAVVRAVACPDKFRGSLSAAEAATAIATGLERAGFDDVVRLPLADGGEGTLEALLAARGGSRRTARVTGPLGEMVEAMWAVLPGGTAVVEMARASGLALVGTENDPLRASTRGTGELIAVARREGFKQVIVAVGGSATTDGGLGAVDALGWSLQGIDVMVACDVTTAFPDAAAMYGRQKGASDAQISLLTRRLARLAQQYEARTGVDVTRLEGGGAAGGLAGGLAAIGAHLAPGFDVVADALQFELALDDALLAVTGEGRVDAGSLEGKVVAGVLDWCEEYGVPAVTVIAGQVVESTRRQLVERAGVNVFALTDRAYDEEEAFTRAALLVEEAALEAGRLVLTGTATGRPGQ
jgi:glycerate 2-kinase